MREPIFVHEEKTYILLQIRFSKTIRTILSNIYDIYEYIHT